MQAEEEDLAIAHSSLLTPPTLGKQPSPGLQWGWGEHSGRNVHGLVSAKSRLWNRQERPCSPSTIFSKGLISNFDQRKGGGQGGAQPGGAAGLH